MILLTENFKNNVRFLELMKFHEKKYRRSINCKIGNINSISNRDDAIFLLLSRHICLGFRFGRVIQ